jgi:hypothetical protein
LARQSVGVGHPERPEVSEKGLWPLFVIVQTLALTRSVLLFSQHRPQATPDEGID